MPISRNGKSYMELVGAKQDENLKNPPDYQAARTGRKNIEIRRKESHGKLSCEGGPVRDLASPNAGLGTAGSGDQNSRREECLQEQDTPVSEKRARDDVEKMKAKPAHKPPSSKTGERIRLLGQQCTQHITLGGAGCNRR